MPANSATAAAAHSPSPVPGSSLLRYWTPRYWPAWLLIAWLRLTATLPWRLAIRLHQGIGIVFWALLARRRRAAEATIAQCFPGLDRGEVRRLGRRHFASLAACLAEAAFAWFGKVDESLTDFRIEGDEHVYRALAAGHGVILYTGHFTPIEICGPILKQIFPLVGYMFNGRRNPLLDEIQRRGRQHTGHIPVPSDDVRVMLRALRQNAVVWYAPDQCFSTKSSLMLPFFGKPSIVSTGTCRLARASGAAVIPFAYHRLPDDSGYVLRFEPALEPAQLDDTEQCTRTLLATLERFIGECPEQYGWTSSRQRRPAADRPGTERKPSAWPAFLAVMGVALFVTLVQNGSFFDVVLNSTRGDPHRLGILASMFLLVMTATAALLLPTIGSRSFKTVASLSLIVSAAAAYFMSRYGIVVDTSMIRNVAETDIREASPLLTFSALFHVFVYGIVPAGMVCLLPLRRLGVRREIGLRFGALGTLLALFAGTVYLNYGPVTFFGHENHALRMQINPAYPIYSLISYAVRAEGKPPPEREPLVASRVLAPTPPAKPTLFVFVMGETARADRFSLNGYARDTNAFTSAYDIVNFPRVTSCGTSTAESLPCLFSSLDHDDFSHAAFARNETLVQLLGRLGVQTLWRDNSTGCKYICEPDHYESLAGAGDPEFCRDDVCVDEILLEHLDAVLADDSRDRFIVLHQRGSHGPVYYTDTPDWAKVYLPECNLADLRTCDQEAINNAYDNTIRYTDFFLAQVIERLEQESDRYATAMLYVSDHGESLGEKGLYLHGLPYAIAPAEQTEVPMLFWGSENFYRTQQIDETCLRSGAAAPVTHDAIFHSILPVFDIQAADYDPALDIFAACRQTPTLPNQLSSARI